MVSADLCDVTAIESNFDLYCPHAKSRARHPKTALLRPFYSAGRSLVPRERTTYAGEECGRQCDGSSYKPAS